MIISHFSPYYTKYRLKCTYHLSVGIATYHVGVLSLHSYPINLIICDYSLIYIYIRLKIKPNSVRIRFYSCQIFVLPSTGFEPTPLIHCSTIRLALRPAPYTTRPHPLPIYIYSDRKICPGESAARMQMFLH